MTLQYEEQTSSLYIDLAAVPNSDSRKISDGVVVDYDEHEQIVSLNIQHASSRLDLSRIDVSHLPLPTALAS